MFLKNKFKKDYFFLFAKGFAMGCVDIIPGVSGGTMALILGIYEKLIYAIRSFNKKTIGLLFTKQRNQFFQLVEWRFLLVLGSGIVLAILTLAKPIGWLLENKTSLVFATFFGLILGSVYVLRTKIKKWNFKIFLFFLLGVLIGFGIINLTPAQTPENFIYIFLSGFIAIIAMILPGISGSFILVILGKYQQVLGAVNEKNIIFIIIFALGALIGILSFSSFLSWLLSEHYNSTMGVLIGFMLGSVPKLWPWKIDNLNYLPKNLNSTDFGLFGLILFGIFLVFLFEKISNKKIVSG